VPSPASALEVALAASGRWDFEVATTAPEELTLLDADHARSEVTRYLGIPAQAMSYALGERAIVELRDGRRARDGATFDLARFHADVPGGIGYGVVARG
jgi:uncharacterized protein (DUF885 family)